MLILLLPIAQAATIQGSVYDFFLDKEDVIITVNSTPKQTLVVQGGDYTLNLPQGTYLLEAKSDDSFAAEIIVITNEGTYNIDLILFPDLDTELIDETDQLSVEDTYFQKPSILPWIISIGGFIIILYLLRKYAKQLSDVTKEIEQAGTDDLSKKVLDFIK